MVRVFEERLNEKSSGSRDSSLEDDNADGKGGEGLTSSQCDWGEAATAPEARVRRVAPSTQLREGQRVLVPKGALRGKGEGGLEEAERGGKGEVQWKGASKEAEVGEEDLACVSIYLV